MKKFILPLPTYLKCVAGSKYNGTLQQNNVQKQMGMHTYRKQYGIVCRDANSTYAIKAFHTLNIYSKGALIHYTQTLQKRTGMTKRSLSSKNKSPVCKTWMT